MYFVAAARESHLNERPRVCAAKTGPEFCRKNQYGSGMSLAVCHRTVKLSPAASSYVLRQRVREGRPDPALAEAEDRFEKQSSFLK